MAKVTVEIHITDAKGKTHVMPTSASTTKNNAKFSVADNKAGVFGAVYVPKPARKPEVDPIAKKAKKAK
jgi:hypothetical protein